MNTAATTKTRLIALVAVIAFSFAVLLPTGAMAADKAPHKLSAFVQGTANGSPFSGLYQISRFEQQNGVLMAVGNLYSDVLPGGVANDVAIPVAGVDPTCQILNLTLGPLDLNLLGLQIHLNQVVLNVTAQSGNGNLLGNLLCAVANLLNTTPTGPLTGLLQNLTNLLNQILGAL